jgi:hypothetical protein
MSPWLDSTIFFDITSFEFERASALFFPEVPKELAREVILAGVHESQVFFGTTKICNFWWKMIENLEKVRKGESSMPG